MHNFIIGIDISKLKLDICILGLNKPKYLQYDNNEKGFKEFDNWLESKDIFNAHICLEATGGYSLAVAEYFHSKAFNISIINPFRIKTFRKTQLIRNKNDQIDSLLIAEFCKLYQPTYWQPEEQEIQKLKQLYRALQNFINEKSRFLNKLDKSPIKEVAELFNKHTKAIDDKIARLRVLIDKHIKKYDNIRNHINNLESVPGIGRDTAVAIMAEIPNFNNFKSAREIAAYAGLTPMQNRSGTSVKGRTKISKIGSASLRKALYFPAITARQFNPLMKEFSERLTKNGKPKMVIIAAIMRKLLHIAFGIIKSGKPFNPLVHNI